MSTTTEQALTVSKGEGHLVSMRQAVGGKIPEELMGHALHLALQRLRACLHTAHVRAEQLFGPNPAFA
eukprot:CAMPEP_0172661362 /NCGR_PEP_ID=MMETSP1074-20121228/4651_1 /TAXON_ID=2916 /ORGANISM="Ceratium fusus, Strain PA161109" /LENGTH=67 /DNA_ID=CAMNT_0013477115 /DNA_START=1317 /DNA_END=1516 /DNA_ORIENTATION=+